MKITAWILLSTLGWLAAAAAPAAEITPAACCPPPAGATAMAAATTNFTDKSVYQTESKWTTDAGPKIKIGELAGKPQVVAMFFTHCQYACPIIVNDMRRIAAALPAEQRARVGFTLVSFDTKRDTPAVLAAYRRTHALPAANWTLLRGGADDVLELAALLGVKFKEDANGQFSHSNLITLLNSEGEIVQQQTGLNQDIKAMVRQLRQLAPK